MSTSRVILAVGVVASLGLAAGCRQPAAEGFPEADQAAIRQATASAEKAVNARDFAAWAATYAEDAAMLPPNAEAVQGRAAIQAWAEAFPPVSDFRLQQLDLDGRGDLAYVRGTYSMVITPPGAAPATDRGKYLEIWRKQSDGSWKIARDMFNSDVPPPSPAPTPAPVTAPKK
jgi:uncharacterized protein (TIGR02246 family)